jgi:hypothetical protein
MYVFMKLFTHAGYSIHVHTHVHIHTHMHTYISIYTCICTYIERYVRVWVIMCEPLRYPYGAGTLIIVCELLRFAALVMDMITEFRAKICFEMREDHVTLGDLVISAGDWLIGGQT